MTPAPDFFVPPSSASAVPWWSTVLMGLGALGVGFGYLRGPARWLWLRLSAGGDASERRETRLDAKANAIIDQGQENAAALLKRAQDAEARADAEQASGLRWMGKASSFRERAVDLRHDLRGAYTGRMESDEFERRWPPLPPLEG